MYDERFGTEWESLDREEAIDRAYALGLLDACGDARVAEAERVLDTATGVYERSLLELAYDEGRTEALDAPAEGSAAVWRELIDGSGTPRALAVPSTLPATLRDLPIARKPNEGPPASLDLPSLLRK